MTRARSTRSRSRRGFWMFDTPCTQALWAAVMGENPSRSAGRRAGGAGELGGGPGFPVSDRGELVPGLRLGLPSEEQWEYACRAGIGDGAISGDLDEIAWYC